MSRVKNAERTNVHRYHGGSRKRGVSAPSSATDGGYEGAVTRLHLATQQIYMLSQRKPTSTKGLPGRYNRSNMEGLGLGPQTAHEDTKLVTSRGFYCDDVLWICASTEDEKRDRIRSREFRVPVMVELIVGVTAKTPLLKVNASLFKFSGWGDGVTERVRKRALLVVETSRGRVRAPDAHAPHQCQSNHT